jgi:POT family proton-dependent oligopeptide transporter
MAKPKHPPGLYVLFFTEMWERFSFYTMFAVFVLYMDETLKFGDAKSTSIYGAYNLFVYLTPLVGGIVADRYLGCRKTVLIGALFMAAGQFLLWTGPVSLFYLGLVALCAGNGFFKPNISTMVGNLYPQNSPLRDSAFNIFYVGINIGAFLAPLAAAKLHEYFGYRWAFFAAGVGMLLSMVIITVFRSHVDHADGVRAKEEGEADIVLTKAEERSRFWTLMLFFTIVVIFWTAYMQYGDVLTLWARDNTRVVTLPLWGKVLPETYQSVNPVFIFILTPALVWLWGFLNARRKEPSTGMKMVLGMLVTAISFLIMVGAAASFARAGAPVSAGWLVSFYGVITLAELLLSPMGLSYVTRVAPPRMRSTMMGLWFVASAVGGWLAGVAGVLWQKVPHPTYFLLLAGMSMVGFLLMAVFYRQINRAEEASAGP